MSVQCFWPGLRQCSWLCLRLYLLRWALGKEFTEVSRICKAVDGGGRFKLHKGKEELGRQTGEGHTAPLGMSSAARFVRANKGPDDS